MLEFKIRVKLLLIPLISAMNLSPEDKILFVWFQKEEDSEGM